MKIYKKCDAKYAFAVSIPFEKSFGHRNRIPNIYLHKFYGHKTLSHYAFRTITTCGLNCFQKRIRKRKKSGNFSLFMLFLLFFEINEKVEKKKLAEAAIN